MRATQKRGGQLVLAAGVVLLLAMHTGCQSAPHAPRAHRPPFPSEASLARLTAPLERAAGMGLSVANAATAIAFMP